MAMWEDGDDGAYEKGLLEVAEECGIEKFMMDTAVTPLGQGAGIAARTSFAEKAKWGYPVGSGIHNVPSAWDWLREYKKAGNKPPYEELAFIIGQLGLYYQQFTAEEENSCQVVIAGYKSGKILYNETYTD
jgi:N5-methyltetrahydromethanopterin:coenzyme M methyltransferase subunit H